MSDITKSTGFVSLDKDGHLSIDGVKLNIRELLNTIDQKPTTYIQVDMPTKYNILDWWYNPDDGVLCMSVFLDNKLAWKETTFGTNSLLKNVTAGSEISGTMLNNIMNDFYAKVTEIGCKVISGEVLKNDGSLTNGEIAFRKTKVINYIYNGDLSLPPLIQTGGKLWNRDRNGFNKLDSFTQYSIPLDKWENINFDSIYNYANKTYTLTINDRTTPADTNLMLGNIYGETAIELIGEDLVFSMDVNVTKACQVALTFYVKLIEGEFYYIQTPKVFNLTPGRKIEKVTFTLNNSTIIKSLTMSRNRVSIIPMLFLENVTSGNYDNTPAFPIVQNNTFTFYGFKLNKGTVPLDNIKDDFRNMDFYKNMFPLISINSHLDNINTSAKPDFSSGWNIPSGVTVTTYKTILNDGTPFASRDTESKEILTAMGYGQDTPFFRADIVIKKITWTARSGACGPYYYHYVNALTPTTSGAFVKLLSGATIYNYSHGAELGKWKLCTFTITPGIGDVVNNSPWDINSTGTGGGEMLVAMPGVVKGHVDNSNPTNWRIY